MKKPLGVIFAGTASGLVMVYNRGGFDKVTDWSEVLIALVVGGGCLLGATVLLVRLWDYLRHG